MRDKPGFCADLRPVLPPGRRRKIQSLKTLPTLDQHGVIPLALREGVTRPMTGVCAGLDVPFKHDDFAEA